MFLDLVFLFILDIYAEVGLLDHIVVLFLVLIFLETSILFCTIASPIYIPISSVQGFPFLHILANISLWSFWASLVTQLVKNLSAMWETWI